MAARNVHTPFPTAVSHWPSPGNASSPSPVLVTTNISGNAACCVTSTPVAAQSANAAAEKRTATNAYWTNVPERRTRRVEWAVVFIRCVYLLTHNFHGADPITGW